ncbi:MAG: enoyl-CoA hydratase/isomerase family protein, partial [Bacteroidia bacterium]|nr:enoyl-CoA hydratase/isomerase family protein [Bacteroidia bacterium]
TEIYSSINEMDNSIFKLAETLMLSSPEAMAEMKKIFWKGTEHWDALLIERAAISGRLVLSDLTKKAIEKFKKK